MEDKDCDMNADEEAVDLVVMYLVRILYEVGQVCGMWERLLSQKKQQMTDLDAGKSGMKCTTKGKRRAKAQEYAQEEARNHWSSTSNESPTPSQRKINRSKSDGLLQILVGILIGITLCMIAGRAIETHRDSRVHAASSSATEERKDTSEVCPNHFREECDPLLHPQEETITTPTRRRSRRGRVRKEEGEDDAGPFSLAHRPSYHENNHRHEVRSTRFGRDKTATSANTQHDRGSYKRHYSNKSPITARETFSRRRRSNKDIHSIILIAGTKRTGNPNKSIHRSRRDNGRSASGGEGFMQRIKQRYFAGESVPAGERHIRTSRH